jgi:hypothetical protein
MTLPDFPIDNKIEKVSVYRETYTALIVYAFLILLSDFSLFKGNEFRFLHIFNILKLVLLISLHPFFKKQSQNQKEETQIRSIIAIAFAFPINIFFAYSSYEQYILLDGILNKESYYYSFQFIGFLLLGVSVLRLDFVTSAYINSSYFLFYCILIFFLQKIYFNSIINIVHITEFLIFGLAGILSTGINFYLDKFSSNQKKFEEQTYFWRNYSENLVKTNLDKTFYFQNICLLYFDISGMANYFRANQTLGNLDTFLKTIFVDIDEYCKSNKIDLHEEEGRYWFKVIEHPSNTNPEYADPLADLALFMQSRFKRVCSENRLNFELRMGMSSWKYIDYKVNAQKLDIFYVNKAFNDAQELEKFGINGEIQVSEETHSLLKTRFLFVKRGSLNFTSDKEKIVYILNGRA